MSLRYFSGVSTLSLDSEKCVGCGSCVEVCPHAVFAIEEKKARILDKDACIECGACKKNCSFGAINVRTGVGCAAAIIGSFGTGKAPCCGGDDGKGGNCCG